MKVHSQTRVNTYTNSTQDDPAVAALKGPSGGYVVTWTSGVQDGSGTGVYAQRYTASGVATGAEFRVNTNTSSGQQESSVTGLSDGSFLVSWVDQSSIDGSSYGVYARHYSATGVVLGSDFRVNTTTSSDQGQPSVAAYNGGYVVTWYSNSQDGSSYGVYTQRYNNAGVAQGVETRANTTTANGQYEPDVAAIADGSYVVVWRSDSQDGSGAGVYAQRYSSAGVAQGAEFRANTTTANNQYEPRVAMLADGGFVVVWRDDGGHDGSGNAVYAQRFDASGAAQGGEFRVNESTSGSQYMADVEALSTGGFVVTWHNDNYGLDGNTSYADIYVREYSSAGVPTAGEQRVNTPNNSSQYSPALADLGSGNYVVVFVDNSGADGSGAGIYQQLFGDLAELPRQADPTLGDFGGTVTFGENTVNAAPQVLDASVSLADLDSANFDGGRITLFYVSNSSAEDQLTVVHQGNLPGQIGLAGAVVSFGGVQIGTLSGGVNGANLEITLNANATVDAVEELIQHLGYGNTSSSPGATRAVSIRVEDGDGGSTGGGIVTINVTRELDGTPAAYGEDRVNTYVAGEQSDPEIGRLADGGYVIVWDSNGQDGSSWGVYAQRYSASGVAIGPEWRVNTLTGGQQNYGHVAGLSDGSFVITWQDDSNDGSGWGVYGQRYDAAGTPQGANFLMNAATSGNQYHDSVVAYTGGFAAVWSGNGQAGGSGQDIVLQRYNNAGAKVGTEVLVNTAVAGSQELPDVAASANGNLVIVWQDTNGTDGSGYGVFARRFDAASQTFGAAFQVNTITTGNQYEARVAMLSNGGFVVVYGDSNGPDGSGWATYARVYDAAGNALGDAFQVNEYTSGNQYQPTVTGLSTGGFVVSFYNDSTGPEGTYGDVILREYDNAGTAIDGDRRVNSYVAGSYQYEPAIEDLGNGNFVVVWRSDTQDSNTTGVYQQLFGNVAELPRQANPDLGDLVDTVTFNENTVNAGPQLIDPAVSLTDADSSNFNGGRLDLYYTTGNSAQDQLSVLGQGNGTGQIGVAGNVVSYGGVAIGVISGGGNGANLRIDFNSNAASLDAVEALIQRLAYANNSSSPNAARTVNLRVSDGDGGSSVPSTFTINVVREVDGTPSAYGEDRVNTYVAGEQSDPEIGRLADGGYVIVWDSNGQDGSSWGVYAQRYTASGVAIGPEWRVNTLTGGQQNYGHVAGLSDGSFVITWQDDSNDGSGWGVYGQRYDAAGTAQGSSFVLNTTTSSTQYHDSVVAYTGGFAAVWASGAQAGGSGYDIVLQRYNNAGAKVGGELLVNSVLGGTQELPDVAAAANGNLVIIWQDTSGADGSGYGVYGRRFDAASQTFGAAFQVNTIAGGNQYEARVALLSNGGFVVVFGDSGGQDGSGWATFARVYDAAGVAQGDAFQVNEYTSGSQYQPTVTGLSTGGFVVSFYNDSTGPEGTYGDVILREYDNAGNAIDGDRRVNSYAAGSYQYEPAIEDLGNGNFVVAWRSDSQDSGTTGVYQQLFGDVTELPRQANPDLGDFTGTVTFAENAVNAGPQVIDAAVSLIDIDSANFNGGRLDLYYVQGGSSQDQLSVLGQGNGAGQIGVAGNVVSYGGVAIGLISGGTNGANLRIDFNSNSATPDAIEALIQRLAYANTSQSPNPSRGLGLRVSDGDGGSSPPNLLTINVTPESDGVPVAHGEEQVNTYETSHQQAPEIAVFADGSYVVTWQSSGQDGSSEGIYAQRFSAKGVAVGVEFRVNATTTGEQSGTHAATLSDGGFVITWQDNGGADGSGWGVMGQRYNAAGTAQGTNFVVNTTVTSTQYQDAVASYGSGFAVVWASTGNAGGNGYDIYLKRFDNSGAVVTGETRISTTPGTPANAQVGTQQTPDVAAYANGNLVIVWYDQSGNDGSSYGVYGRRYDAAGGTLSDTFLVNTGTAGAQYEPKVATLADGGFIVVWRSDQQDGSSAGVYGQRYDSAGVKAGGEFLINESTTGGQYQPAVTGLSTGGFVVSWYNDNYDTTAAGTTSDVYIREYDAGGNALDGQRKLVSGSNGEESTPAIADLGNGNFIVAYTDYNTSANGGNNTYEVMQQLFGDAGELARPSANPGLDDLRATRVLSQAQAITPQVIDNDLSASDTDSANFDVGRLVVFITSGGDANDALSIQSVAAPLAGQFNLNGSNLYYGGTAAGNLIGTVSGGTGGTPLTIVFNASVTPDLARAVAENVTYQYNAASAPVGSRTIAFRLFDGDGGASDPQSVTISIAATAPAAVLSLTDLESSVTLAETAAQAGVLIDASVQLEAGAAGFSGGTLTVSYTANSRVEDQLAIRNQGSGSGQVGFAGGNVSFEGVLIGTSTGGADGTSLVVTFNASATADAIEHVIENLRYQTSSDGPLASRTIQVQVRDAASATTAQSMVINITPELDGASPLFGEQQVNSYEPGEQALPRLAALEGPNAGAYVVVWRSDGQDGSGYGVFGQRYTAAGVPDGTEFQINSLSTAAQQEPQVTGLSNGGFVVAWRSEGQDGSSGGVYAQRYGADGNAAGAEFRANTTISSDQTHATVLGLSGGGFLITWAGQSQDSSGYGVFGQRYDAAGATVGAEFQLNTYLPNDQYTPALAALKDDPSTAGTNETGFVAVWVSNAQDGSSWGIYGQRYDAAGAKAGGEFKANTTTANAQTSPDVATLANGDFVVVWSDDSTSSVRGQRYTAGGVAVGTEFTATNQDYVSNYGRDPHVAALGNGGFVISWDGTGSPVDGGYGVYAQQFSAGGAKVDGPLLLSSTTAPTQLYPDIVGLTGGNFVGVWQSYNQEASAANTYGIFSQLFGTPGSIARQESPQLLDLEASVTYLENTVNAAPQIIDPGVRVVDTDSANLAGGKLIVSVINGYGAGQGFDPAAAAQDHFSIRNQGTGAGQVGLNGSTVTYGGVAIGSIVTNGQNGSDLVVLWNASATPTGAEAVIENLTYRNSSSDPVASRQVSIVVSDGDGGQSAPQNTITINVTGETDGASRLLANDQQVNTYIAGRQEYAEIGALQGANAGQYVVVWQSNLQDTDSNGVFGQRYDVNGSAIGAEFQVNTTTPGAQEGAQGVGIGGLSNGGFVVTWEAPDGSGDGIFAQRYDAAGKAAGTEFKVSPVTTYEQTQGHVLGLAGGAFVIAWADDNNADSSSYGVRVQHYNAAGVAQGGPVLVNTTPPGAPSNSFTNGNQSYPELALLNDGGYVITWHSQGQDGDDWGVYARLMNADGTARADAFQVNTATTAYQGVADVAVLAGGDFVVAFRSSAPGLNGWAIVAQRFTAAGVKVGGEVLVNDGATIPISDALPHITALDTGGYVIAWHASGPNSYESYAQQFDALSNKVDAPLQLNSYISSTQYLPAIAGLTGGRFVAAWQSYNQEPGGTNDYGIFQNLYGAAGSLVKSAAPEITDLTTSITVGENVVNAAAGIVIDNAVSVFDADSADFGGGQLVVSVIAGYNSLGTDLNENLPTQDQFFIRSQGSAAGQVDVVGSNVRYGGVVIGSIVSDGSNGNDLIIQWNASATQKAVEVVIENLSYRNTSTDPVPVRTVSLVLSDGDGTTGAPRVVDIHVTPEADGPVPLYAPERVNTYTANAQQAPDIVHLASGGYVIVWESQDQDGWGDGLFGQRYDAIGTPVGNEFRVSTYTPSNQAEPSITALGGGGFVVAFRSENRDGSGAAVIAQRFDDNGARVGNEMLVNTTTVGNQYQPTVTALNDGGFAVAWYSDNIRDGRYYDVFFQRYNAAGVAVGSEVRANTSTGFENSTQYEPNILQLDGGDIVVAWRGDAAQDGSLSGVYAQRFNSAGVAQGVEFRLNTTTENYQYDVQLARHGTGFVAVWTSREQDGSADGVYGRLFDASGNPTGAEFRVNETSYHYQYEPAVATLSNGGFVVTWHGYNGQTGNYDVMSQQYDAAGNRVDGETRLDNTTGNTGQNVAALANGAFVVAWQGNSDGDGSGIYQRIVGNAADFPRQSVPVLVDLATSVTFLENDLNAAPQRIDPGVGLFDSDSANFDGGRLDVSLVTPYGNANQFDIPGINAQDQLGIRNQGTGTAQIGVAGLAVSYEGTVIGTIIANGVNGGPLAVLFNANATAVAVEALVENLTYQNFLSNPEPSRTISVRVSDGDGGVSAPQAVTINITPQSDGAVPFGAQQTVNTTVAGQQYSPSLARLADNGYVVVWEDQSGADGSSYGVYGQRYDVSDNKVGGQFLVNTTTTGAQYEPEVASLSGGGFAVVWRADNSDGSGAGVYMQRFAADGSRSGVESLVNTSTVGSQYQPVIAQSSTGGFIVAWYSDNQRDGQYYDVFFQRYDAAGVRLGFETRANTPISGNNAVTQYEPSIALLNDGRFVITWRSDTQDGNGSGVYAQRFNADGSANGTEQRINTTTQDYQYQPDVAALKDGGYVIVWRSDNQDTSGGGIYGQRFDASGAAVGGEFRVNYLVNGTQTDPTVASLVNGGFVVSWDDGSGIWLQQYDASGRQVDSQQEVNPTSSTNKGSPDLVEMPDGGFVVAYQGYLTTANGGNDTWDIRLQRFANSAPNVQDVVVSGPEDTPVVLTEALFASGFSDAEGQALAAIRIITLPASGTLKLNGVAVQPNQEISAAQLAAGLLTYQGNLNYYGADQFRWTGSDGNIFASNSVFTNITITNVNDGPGLEAGVDATASEGIGFSHGITLGDPDLTDNHLVTVSWVGNHGQTGSYQFTTGSPTPSINLTLPDDGNYVVTVKADDQQGQPNSVETDTFNVVVANVAPTIGLSGNNTVEQGQVYTLTFGGVNDPGTDTETSFTINWGDGTPPQVVNVADLPPNRQLTHTFATAGSFSIAVAVTDEDGTFPSAGTRNVTVSAPAEVIVVNAGADTAANEGVFFSRTITFTDPADQDPAGRQVTVNWGDGTAADVFNISGAATSFNIGHTFADNRATPFEVSVTVDDSGAQQGNDKFLVTVNDVAPTLSVFGNGSVSEGSPYTISLGGVTDTGADTVSEYRIHWGDGSSQTILSANIPANRQFTHTYADGDIGGTARSVTVDLVNEDGTFLVAGQRDLTVLNVAPVVPLSGADSVNEGSSYTLSLGSLVDPGTDTPTLFRLNWGDGSTVQEYTPAQFATLLAGGGTVSHVFADGGNGGSQRTIILQVLDEDGTHTAGSKSITVGNVAPALTLTGATSSNEGSSYTLNIAATDPGAASDPLSYSINWGDGSAVQNLSAAQLAVLNGNVAHVFADDDDGANNASTRSINVTVNDGDGGITSQTKDVTVNNVAPTAPVTGADSINEASVYALSVGAVTDPGTDTRTGYSIAWGDGSTSSFTVAQWAAAAGSFNHTYADGGNGGTATTITVSATDEDGTFVIGSKAITVNNVGPTLAISGANSINEGGSYLLSINGSDVAGAADPLTYAIDWGDGTAVQNLTAAQLAAQSGNVSHTFADDDNGPNNASARNISVTVNDGDGGTANQVKGITVNNVAPTAAVTGANSVNEGSAYTLNVGAVSDPGTDTRTAYAIDWGDGSTDNLTAAQWTTAAGSFTHSYADGGNGGTANTIIVSATDEDGTFVLGSKAITVNNVGPVLAITGANSINEGGSYALSISGSDAGGANDPLSYSIDWGDGSAVQNLTAAQLAALSGVVNHVFADDDDGPNNASARTIAVTVNDGDGGTANQSKGITVNNVAPVIALTGAATGQVGLAYTLNLGAVTDPGQDTVTSYLINWGDGNTETVNTAGNVNHTYATTGQRSIVVGLVDEDGSWANAGSLSVDVAPATQTLSFDAGGDATLNEGSLFARTINFGDGQDNGAAGWSYTIDYGDGTVVNGSTLVHTVDLSHTYADGNATRAVSITITDVAGESATDGFSVTVNNVAPTADVTGADSVNEAAVYTLNVGAITDPGADTRTGYSIAWGDGSTSSFTAAQWAAAAGSFTHSYADGGNGGTVNTITVSATDEDGIFVLGSKAITVNNVGPALAISGAASLNEGGNYALSITGSDAAGAADPLSYTIDWGDGSAVQNLTAAQLAGLGGTVQHTYADDNDGPDNASARSINVTVNDGDGGTASQNKGITVNNVAPTAPVTGANSVNEGGVYTLNIGTVVEPGTDTRSSYSIDWGDGSTDNLTADQWTAAAGSFTHSYADGGNGGTANTIVVSATDEDGTFVLGSKAITVNNVAPGLLLAGAASLDEGGTYTLSISGSDAAGANDPLGYSIDWGDGSAVQSLTAAQLAALGGNVNHVFADDDDGPNNASARNIAVTVNDGDGGSTSQQKGITVNNVAPVIALAGAATVQVGLAYTLNLGAVTDPGQDTVTSYVIDWGDGNTETLNSAGNVNHTYATTGQRSIVVGLVDEDGSWANAGSLNVDVAAATPTVAFDAGADAALNEGALFERTINFGDGQDNGAAGWSYTIDYGDGTVVTGNTLVHSVDLSHVYADGNATRAVSVTVTDVAGESATDGFSVTVNNVAPTAAVTGADSVNEAAVYTLNVGAIADPGADTRTGYSIAWGDGSTSSFTAAQWAAAAGSFTHSYADGGSGGTANTIVVSTTDEDGSFVLGSKAITVNNVAPTVLLSGAASLNEGGIYTLNIAGSDAAGANDPLSYSIDWGDGSAAQTLTAAQLAALGGNVNHVFADDDDGPNNASARTITVTAADGDGGSVSQGHGITVNNVAPTIAVSGAAATQVGQTYTLNLGAVTDPGQDTVSSYIINWGDGNTQTVSANGNVDHVFGSAGNRTVSVSLVDEDGTWSNAGSVSVGVGSGQAETVRIGDAPIRQTGAGGQWQAAWSHEGIDIEHKADATNGAEAWSAVSLNGASPQTLAGIDIFSGDLGVSGQSVLTSSVRQEIDGKEALRINLDHEATQVTMNLSRFFINDDGTVFTEGGLLRLLDANGQVVGETAFAADNVGGTKQVSLSAAAGFVSVELMAGGYHGTEFNFGSYVNPVGGLGSTVYTDANGQQHGSDFLVDWVEFQFAPTGVPHLEILP